MRLIVSGLLMGVALFMALGFYLAESDVPQSAIVAGFIVSVVIPAAGSIALARSHFRKHGDFAKRREALRQQTIESDVLRLAMARGGRLTTVEVVAELAIPAEHAQSALESLARREMADIAVSDSGVIVYTFHDIERLGEKARAKGLLE